MRDNPQSAMRKMQQCFTHSNHLELHGPGNGLKFRPRSSRGVRSVLFLAQVPNPPTTWVIEGVGGREIEK
eukprot:13312393-Alexandrium_andersonii.AAC.1